MCCGSVDIAEVVGTQMSYSHLFKEFQNTQTVYVF